MSDITPRDVDAVPVVLSVCVNCRGPDPDGVNPGEALLAALRAAAPADHGCDLRIRPVQCLSVCKRPCTAALASPGRYTYVFGDLDPARDAAALLDCVRTYAEREHGYMLWRERPEALRGGIVSRIPPVVWDAPDGAHPR